MASSITEMQSTTALKATPHLLIVLDSDTDYAEKDKGKASVHAGGLKNEGQHSADCSLTCRSWKDY